MPSSSPSSLPAASSPALFSSASLSRSSVFLLKQSVQKTLSRSQQRLQSFLAKRRLSLTRHTQQDGSMPPRSPHHPPCVILPQQRQQIQQLRKAKESETTETLRTQQLQRQTNTTKKKSALDTLAAASSSSSSSNWFLCGCHPTLTISEDETETTDTAQHTLAAASIANTANTTLADDPTIQESIECIFPLAQQHDELLPPSTSRRRRQRNKHAVSNHHRQHRQQSLLDEEEDTAEQQWYVQQRIMEQLLKTAEETADYEYQNDESEHIATTLAADKAEHARIIEQKTTTTQQQQQPQSPPSAATTPCSPPPISSTTTPRLEDARSWPQYPLLLRAHANTKVLGIRYTSSNKDEEEHEYLWTPQQEQQQGMTWLQALHKDWENNASLPSHTNQQQQQQQQQQQTHVNFAACNNDDGLLLPVNNGNEELGKALVTDFETPFFKGSLLIRIRHTEGTTPHPYDDTKGYFFGVNRRYQCVVRGKFRQRLLWTDLLTGFHLDKPCGKLPPKFIVKGALKVISFFAPQLQAKVDGQNPHILTPLGSTPQCIILQQDDESDNNSTLPLMDGALSEPTKAQETLLGHACNASSSMQRARYRKKHFDRIYAAATTSTTTATDNLLLYTDPSKIYTFEFLQHLLDFEAFSIELGNIMGSIPLAPILNGQGLQIMACNKQLQYLWNFELWHVSLIQKNGENHHHHHHHGGGGKSSGSHRDEKKEER